MRGGREGGCRVDRKEEVMKGRGERGAKSLRPHFSNQAGAAYLFYYAYLIVSYAMIDI